MKTKLLVCALLLATAVVVYAYPLRGGVDAQPNPPQSTAQIAPAVAPRPVVEVVFVLDTTGSMSGLIDAAKANIWSIARTMASAQPQPDIRVGLVAYRDRGDNYVTQVVDLSSDLDSMYATLMDFTADGGGDGPEAVNEALYDAVHTVKWSQDPKAYQVIFLVGDAQPHMDYSDDVKYPITLKAAAAKGIIVNTVQAGDDSGTTLEWQQIASLSQGAYFKVGQGGDAVAVSTPFDADMARLSKELDETRLFYGDEKERARAAGKTAATAKLNESGSVGSLAQRAAFNASASGAKNFLGDSELVDDVSNGRVDLASVDKSTLPEPLRELSVEEQKQVIADTKTKREELSSSIAALSDQRQQYIETELKKDANVAQSLDYQIYGAVKEQGARKGLSYEAAPAH
jgi:Mg-chelatase subunit ChlD